MERSWFSKEEHDGAWICEYQLYVFARCSEALSRAVWSSPRDEHNLDIVDGCKHLLRL